MEARTGRTGPLSAAARPGIPAVEWDEERAGLRVVLLPQPDGPETTVAAFRTVCWVSFAASGAVCAVDVHDIPVEVSDRLPPVPGDDVIGRGLVDTQWLWVPLSTEPKVHRRVGVADVEVTLSTDGLARLSLRFLEESEDG
ncbi:hypothetical protein [Kitasatospora sp. HPMI-4]|uniref:hypothetical protein n=1 Tax=Kitasatospora sp. HPMI-4 TaxID=3448443 RepID=UPI003F1D747D